MPESKDQISCGRTPSQYPQVWPPQENSAANAVPNTKLAKSKVLREIR